MSADDEPPETLPVDPAPPEGMRVQELEIGGETLLVISYPIDEPDLEASTPLSSAEAEVTRLAVRGLSNADIAAARGTSVRTVANQMASILRKLGLSSRRELAARYLRGEVSGAERE